ncbi:SHOCT domain-containing protein [Streptomyces sp. HNM0663]|uniref:SHOCT domain-containing protein n=1 Tax=Streptomyces chengmaiensis TaxID=3040919 RepID=A0ABT6HLE6_9ACTN|nr:SHOCT domain-containing protein [Streptomyces chengmaiensis]MDH2388869.1 SHOCT domain-containing protein [Streptomyces chengmaiensis]
MTDFPLLNLFLTMLWFFIWILWLMLLFRIIADIFRDDSMGGWGKTGWTVFVCLLPFLGVFVYLVARGRDMGERELRHARRQEEAFRSYVREAAESPPGGGAGTGHADELAKLAGLREQGDLTAEEYERAKTRVLAG